jgi:Uma2 family endonuclease
MGMAATEGPWTRDDVLDLIARNPLLTPRYELVDGVLLVTPAPSSVHQFAVSVIHRYLAIYLLSERAVGDVLTSPSDVMPEHGVTVGPDVFVVPRDEARRIRHERPVERLLLAVEVLSPRDRSGDRTRKRRLYQRTIPEYWIVDPEMRQIEVWRPDAASAAVHTVRLEWLPAGAGRALELDVVRYFAEVHGELD